MNSSAAIYSKSIGMRDANSSTAINRTSFYLGIWVDSFAIIDDVSITVTIAVPAAAVSPGKSGRSVTTPEIGVRISE